MTSRKRLLSLLVFSAVLSIEGCNGFGTNCSTDADCQAQNPQAVCDATLKVCFAYAGPVVTSIAPTNGATAVVGANGQVVATFSEPIVDAGVTASSFVVDGQGFKTFGNYLVDSALTHATFEPLAGGLALGTDYTVSLTSAIMDAAGNPLLPFTSTFSTEDGAFGSAGTLQFSTSTGAYTMASNYFGGLVTAVDIYTGAGTSFDFALAVGVADAGTSFSDTGFVYLEKTAGQEVDFPSVGLAPSGAALVAWTTQPSDAGTPLTYTALVNVLDPVAHTWGTNTVLTGPDAKPQFPQVVGFNTTNASALGDDGFAAWLQTVGTKQVVFGNYHNAGSGWLGSGAIQTDSTLAAANVSVSADFDGNVLVVWQSESVGDGPPQVLARYLDINGDFPPPVAISAAGVPASFPVVALAVTGVGAVAWRSETTLTDGGLVSHVFASSFDPTSTSSFSTPVQLDNAPVFADFPQISVAANGNAFAIWQELGSIVSRAYVSATKTWSPAVTLDSDPTYLVNGPSVAVDPGDNALATWLKFNPDGGYQLFGGRYTADAGWHGQQRLTLGTDPVLDIQPVVVVDALGQGVVLETRVPPGQTSYLETIPFK
jgi:hypothetical protein